MIYYSPDTGINEKSLDSSGEVYEKIDKKWRISKDIFSRLEIRIINFFLQHKYNMEINHRSPFISFSENSNKHQYRFTMQILNKYPTTEIKTFIRVFGHRHFPLTDFNVPTEIISKVLKNNVVISGSTGSGKTTFLRSALSHLSKNEHHIIIEDLSELEQESNNFTHLCSQKINQQMDQLVSNALRMSPDRIILGEIRSHEIVSFMLALNTGHTGSMTHNSFKLCRRNDLSDC